VEITGDAQSGTTFEKDFVVERFGIHSGCW
jgi:hypothetical protein